MPPLTLTLTPGSSPGAMPEATLSYAVQIEGLQGDETAAVLKLAAILVGERSQSGAGGEAATHDAGARQSHEPARAVQEPAAPAGSVQAATRGIEAGFKRQLNRLRSDDAKASDGEPPRAAV